MAVTQLEIRARTPYEGGEAFGETGAYERLDGTVRFAVSPDDPANRAIVDLDKAPRDAAGRVHFSADFCLLQPAEPERGNRRLLVEVLNRGRKLLPQQINHAPPDAVPTERIPPGDGWLFRHGYTLVWVGWQWDVNRSPALMGLAPPDALEPAPGRPGETRPMQGRILVRFQPNAPCRDALLADRDHAPYPTADIHDPDAALTVREWPDGPATIIPRDQWRFARDHDGEPIAADTHVRLAGGFAAGRVYEVAYRTRICPVVGTGLLAVRDTASFLRQGNAPDNPCAGRLDHALALGVSQSGRFLRHFLHLGLNADEAGRRVFDGVLPHVAGAWRGEFNHRYAQPSVMNTPNPGHLPPFAYDPVGDAPDGLLTRQGAVGGLPVVVATNTAAEYWRGDASLAHTDPAGERDAEPPPEVRVYLFAAAQHGPGRLPLGNVNPNDGSRGAHPFNALDYVPLLRAALVNLDGWATRGIAPPPSTFPRLADGTAIPASDALAAYRALPGATLPDPALLQTTRRLDFGPDIERGVGRYPPVQGEPYRASVSAVDGDGVETGGVRMPDVAVPVATYTGWNPRHPATGGPGQIVPMQGSTFPFPRTAADRERTGDPRRGITERYRDRNDYLAQVRVAAENLVATRYLLAEDVPLALAIAAERYDAFTR